MLQAARAECGGDAARIDLRHLQPDELSPANTWTPMNLALLVERPGGAIVATHSQSGIMGHHMIRILKDARSARSSPVAGWRPHGPTTV